MSKNNSWIKLLLNDKNFYAPFEIDNDYEYYDDLLKKYRKFCTVLKAIGADETCIGIAEKYTNRILEAVRFYNNGKVSSAHQKIKNLVRECIDNEMAKNSIGDSFAFHGNHKSELQLFRARVSENFVVYEPKDMLHLPKKKRSKTGNYRFSIPGIPSVYLGNSSYACWIELGCPSEHDFNVAPVVLDGTQQIFNLAVMTRDISHLDNCDDNRVHCWLKLIIFMIATSYKVKEENRTFKSEYIVSQSIMLACKELNLDGVAYYSKRVQDEVFSMSAINIALFTEFDRNNEFATVCKHMKIDRSFNYSLYKQLKLPATQKMEYDLRVQQTGLITNIGDYDRQFNYANTDFCNFDQFLFATWKDKEILPFGHAVQ